MAAACSFRSVVRAPPPPRGLARAAVRCCSAAPGAASASKLVLEVKQRLEGEQPGLPTGRNGRDDEEMILWFLKDRKLSVDEAVSKLTKAIVSYNYADLRNSPFLSHLQGRIDDLPHLSWKWQVMSHRAFYPVAKKDGTNHQISLLTNNPRVL